MVVAVVVALTCRVMPWLELVMVGGIVRLLLPPRRMRTIDFLLLPRARRRSLLRLRKL